MLPGLRTVIYAAPDLARSKAWYAKLFGIAPCFDEPFYVGFNVGDGIRLNAPVGRPRYDDT